MMPKESMTCISEDTRKKLDEFIERNYPRLLARARYREKDEGKAEEVLHEVILNLYSGKYRLNFNGSPLRHFEYWVHRTVSHTLENRQIAFEDGYRVEVKNNVRMRTSLRTDADTIPPYKLKIYPLVLDRIEQHEQYTYYRTYKATLPLKHQYILTDLEAGYSIDMIHKALADRGIKRARRWVRDHAKALIQQVEQVMRSVHSPVD